MKFQKIVLSALAIATLFSASSCRKYLDINKSPNAATSVDPGLLFNYASVGLASTRAGGDAYVSLALAAQTIASGGTFGWGAANVYDISIYSIGNTWRTYYATSGNNYKQAIDIAEAAVPRNNNAAAVSRIMMAECLYEATMLWGDVPASEAWNVNISYPKFDSQRVVLRQVISMLDSSLRQIDLTATAPKISADDLFYLGNLDRWRRAANGIKLRALFSMVDKDPSVANEIGALVSSASTNLLSGANDNLRFPFFTTTNTENPKYRLLLRYAGGANTFFFANNSVLQPMLAQNDPRIPRYFDRKSATYVGVNSEATADDSTATISAYLYRANAPELVFSFHEQKFFMAEAYARGLGVPQDLTQANTHYQDALRAACSFYEADGAATNAFVSSKNLTTVANPVNEIHLQQWIDLMDRPIEAFTQWRRSGPAGQEIPTLTIPPGAPNGGLIRRLVYPLAEELAPNPNAPKVVPLIFTPLWFDL